MSKHHSTIWLVLMMSLLLFSLLGLAVGVLGTLIGAGGGFILMPILIFLYPQEHRETLTAMSLSVIFLNALSGSVAYARMKRIDFRAGLIFAAASIPGAILGSMSTAFLGTRLFDGVLGIFLLLISAFLLVRVRPSWLGGRFSDARPLAASISTGASPGRKKLKLGAYLSVGVGYLSSLLGIGGGIIHVPALVFLVGFPTHVATATSHFVLACMTLVGSGTHILAGDLSGRWPQTAAIGVGVVVGAQFGAALSRKVKSKWIIRCLAVALVFVGSRVVFRAFF